MKKLLLLIGILMIGVIVFNSSCSSSPVVKESYTVRFTELDKEIQDTLFAIWQCYQGGNYLDADSDSIPDYIDFIDLTDNYVLEHRKNRLLPWVYDPVVVNKSNGWEHKFPTSEPDPIIIKGDKIYTPTEYNFFTLTSKLDTCHFNVYTIKE
jgi:hypothetical protein